LAQLVLARLVLVGLASVGLVLARLVLARLVLTPSGLAREQAWWASPYTQPAPMRWRAGACRVATGCATSAGSFEPDQHAGTVPRGKRSENRDRCAEFVISRFDPVGSAVSPVEVIAAMDHRA